MLKKPSQKNKNPPREELQTIVDLFFQGELRQVLHKITQMLEQFPDSAILYNFLGTTNVALKQFVPAIKSYETAIKIDPCYAESYNKLAIVLDEIEDFDTAIENFKKALDINPNYAEAHYNMGNVLLKKNQPEKAIDSYRMALELKPDYSEVYNNMGLALKEIGSPRDSMESYKHCLRLNPRCAETYYNMGMLLQDQGEQEAALESYKKAVKIKPDYFKAYNNIGIILKGRDKSDEAIENFKKAIKIKADYDSAYNNMGLALIKKGELEAAMKSFERALQLNPHRPSTYYNKGLCLGRRGMLDESIIAFDKAISLKSNYSDAFYSKGNILRDQGLNAAALLCYSQALKWNPDFFDANCEKLFLSNEICEWGELNKFLPHLPEFGITTPSVHPFPMQNMEDNPERQLKRASKRILEKYNRDAIPLPPRPKSRPNKMHIGYFSADFREHPVSRQISRLLATHNRENVEIYAYSFKQSGDEMSQLIIDSVDHFRDVSEMSDRDVALLARKDNIDIGIDLMGYTKNSRTSIFAFRAAPIQMLYLYESTMGAKFMDYIIADSTMIPPKLSRYYQEKIIYLPHSFMPTDNTRKISSRPITRKEMGLPQNGFVFCCFSASYKISPCEFDIWMRLLHKVKGSVLWLKKSNQEATDNLRKEAKLRGVDPMRLIFADRVPMEEHLARHKLADLFLDTFKFNAHSTASDSLWAGLPVISKIGEQSFARIAASLLTAIGLTELIVKTDSEYESLALELATNKERLQTVTKKLKNNRNNAPLFDSEKYTCDLENAFEKAYELYQTGNSPENIYI